MMKVATATGCKTTNTGRLHELPPWVSGHYSGWVASGGRAEIK